MEGEKEEEEQLEEEIEEEEEEDEQKDMANGSSVSAQSEAAAVEMQEAEVRKLHGPHHEVVTTFTALALCVHSLLPHL